MRSGRGQVDGHRIDAAADLLGQHERAGRVGLGQEHDELVAAIAGRGVDLPNAVGDHLADAAQDAVAMVMAEPVVDRLEVVEVHHQQAEAAPGPGTAGDLAADRREEERSVEQPGQRIDGRQTDRRVAGPTLLAGDDHRRIGQQDERGQVDPDGRGGGSRASCRRPSRRRRPAT